MQKRRGFNRRSSDGSCVASANAKGTVLPLTESDIATTTTTGMLLPLSNNSGHSTSSSMATATTAEPSSPQSLYSRLRGGRKLPERSRSLNYGNKNAHQYFSSTASQRSMSSSVQSNVSQSSSSSVGRSLFTRKAPRRNHNIGHKIDVDVNVNVNENETESESETDRRRSWLASPRSMSLSSSTSPSSSKLALGVLSSSSSHGTDSSPLKPERRKRMSMTSTSTSNALRAPRGTKDFYSKIATSPSSSTTTERRYNAISSSSSPSAPPRDDMNEAYNSISAALAEVGSRSSSSPTTSPKTFSRTVMMGSAHNQHQQHHHQHYHHQHQPQPQQHKQQSFLNRGRTGRYYHIPLSKKKQNRIQGCMLLWGILVFLIGGWIVVVITTSRNVQFAPNNENNNRGVMYKGSYVKGINNSGNNNNIDLRTKQLKSKTNEDFFDRRKERHGPDDHKDFPLPPPLKHNSAERHQQQHQVDRPLSEFPTLQYPLANSELIGLFFGSSDSTASKKMIHKLSSYFGVDGVLLPPSTSSQPNGNSKSRRPKQDDDDNVEKTWPLSLIYVSSDRDMSTFNTLATERSGSGSGVGSEWFKVPWNGPERSGLKRHFRIGATNELKDLDLSSDTRRSDIPALIIIDNQSRSILSANGIEDLIEFGDKSLDHWMDLYDLMRAMEEKYAVDPPTE